MEDENLTFNEVSEVYIRQYEARGIDYDALAEMILQAIKDEHGFNHKQACFIYGIAYEDYHANFNDVIWQSQYFAERMQRWEKIKNV